MLIEAGNAHARVPQTMEDATFPRRGRDAGEQSPVIPYSAMVPGHLSGDYTWDAITIDLVRLCQSVHVRFVTERVRGIDPKTRRVLFAARPALVYDALSLGLGSIPARPDGAADAESALMMRPLAGLVHQIDLLEQKLAAAPQPFHLAVVGGGASGCELALAIHKRLSRHAGFGCRCFRATPCSCRSSPAESRTPSRKCWGGAASPSGRMRVSSAATRDCSDWKAANGSRVTRSSGRRRRRAPPLIRDSGLPVDPAGFLRVRDTLQTVGDPAIFGTGDCVVFDAYPGLPRNGVHAVRQGRVLFENLIAVLREKQPRPFRPRRYCLCLMNTADGQALLNYGPLTWKGRGGGYSKIGSIGPGSTSSRASRR